MSEDRSTRRASPADPGHLPPPPPREADDRVVTGTITTAWAIALVVVGVLAACGVLPARERWWVWTCAAGLAMGGFGLWYVPVLKRRRARAATRRDGEPGPPGQLSGEPSSESRESGSKTVSSTETPGKSTRS
ncbi:MAG: DUF2530 domain-containing protein [Nocardiopsaceae bacterium]|nr:DUF2530 domain-containing protein [Nocardiopsaceae bacterium]